MVTSYMGQCKTSLSNCTSGRQAERNGSVLPDHEMCNGIDEDRKGQRGHPVLLVACSLRVSRYGSFPAVAADPLFTLTETRETISCASCRRRRT